MGFNSGFKGLIFSLSLNLSYWRCLRPELKNHYCCHKTSHQTPVQVFSIDVTVSPAVSLISGCSAVKYPSKIQRKILTSPLSLLILTLIYPFLHYKLSRSIGYYDCVWYAMDMNISRKSWCVVDRASQYSLFYLYFQLDTLFSSVYIQYLLSSFLYMFQASQARHQEV